MQNRIFGTTFKKPRPQFFVPREVLPRCLPSASGFLHVALCRSSLRGRLNSRPSLNWRRRTTESSARPRSGRGLSVPCPLSPSLMWPRSVLAGVAGECWPGPRRRATRGGNALQATSLPLLHAHHRTVGGQTELDLKDTRQQQDFNNTVGQPVKWNTCTTNKTPTPEPDGSQAPLAVGHATATAYTPSREGAMRIG